MRPAGGKAPTPDRLGRDFLYGASKEIQRPAPLPASVDLRHFCGAPVLDQGDTLACGGVAGAALMSYLHPEVKEGFSAEQVYYEARALAGDQAQDSGTETRNILKALEKTGAIPNSHWPFDPAKLFTKPPEIPGPFKIGSYARLIGPQDYLGCLAKGFPFILGFMMPASLDSQIVDQTGILPLPDLSTDTLVGRHLTLCVGYLTGFRASKALATAGIDPKRVDDTMLLIRNSWGPNWSKGYGGHFWMPLSYAANPTTGGDSWTGRISDAIKAMDGSPLVIPPTKPKATPRQLDACFASIRHSLDTHTSYGGWVSDATLRPFTDAAAVATVEAG